MAVGERQLRIAGVLDQVAAACDFVVEQARAAGLDERAAHHCYLAVDEACTNIVEHGYGVDCGACVIDLICQASADGLTITIIDDSAAFDPLLRPDPDPNMPITEREPGGWGIFFIKKLMDSVTYSLENGRNRLTMVKRADQQSASSRKRPTTDPVVDVTPLTEKVWLITPTGRLDVAQAHLVEIALLRQLSIGNRWLILDLSDVDYISSTGLKMLVSVWQRVRAQKGDLALTSLRPRVREVLEMIGLDLVFTITENPDQARAYLSTKVK